MTKERSRLQWVVEDDSEAWTLPTLVWRRQLDRHVFLLSAGPYRAGFAWRRGA